MSSYTVPLSRLRMTDVVSVGGKNASLGEMIGRLAGAGVRVPDGFATTAEAYRRFIGVTGLAEQISSRLADLDTAACRSALGRARRSAMPSSHNRSRRPGG